MSKRTHKLLVTVTTNDEADSDDARANVQDLLRSALESTKDFEIFCIELELESVENV